MPWVFLQCSMLVKKDEDGNWTKNDGSRPNSGEQKTWTRYGKNCGCLQTFLATDFFFSKKLLLSTYCKLYVPLLLHDWAAIMVVGFAPCFCFCF